MTIDPVSWVWREFRVRVSIGMYAWNHVKPGRQRLEF
jgi:hypothetical protein